METLRYKLSDGRYAPRQHVNRHHVFYEMGWYSPRERQQFRDIGGLVVPMWIPAHNNLHANTPPPLKPSRQLQEQVAEFQRSIEGDAYDQFQQIATLIGNVADTAWSAERADEARSIHENLVAQSPYIELGRVEPVWRAA